MFEIYLTGNQLIHTIRVTEGIESVKLPRKDKAAIVQLIDQCRFIITYGDIDSVQQSISSISEEYIYWSSIHLSYAYDNNERSPFSITLPENAESLFISEISDLIEEYEIDVSSSSKTEKYHNYSDNLLPIINESSNELVLYDPFLFDDYSASINTIQALTQHFLSNRNPKITLIGGSKIIATDSKLKSIVTEIQNVFGEDINVSLLKINDVYHDREFICNLFRIKSGDSFNWKKKREAAFSKARGSTIITMSNLFEKRLQFSTSLLNRLFSLIEAKYHNRQIKTTTDYEMKLADNFFQSNFYAYWKASLAT